MNKKKVEENDDDDGGTEQLELSGGRRNPESKRLYVQSQARLEK